MSNLSISNDTLSGAREAYARLLFEFTKRPLTIEDAEFLSFLAQPFNGNSLALSEAQPSTKDFLVCAKNHAPLSIPIEHFSYSLSGNKARLKDVFLQLCKYMSDILREHPYVESPLGLDGCCYTPTFDGLIDYPSLLSQGIQEGFTWVKDPNAVHSLVKGAVLQKSIENYTFDHRPFKSLPFCYVGYSELASHAKAGDRVWLKKLFSQHSVVVIEFAGASHYNYKDARIVLHGIHWYAFRHEADRPEHLLDNGSTRFAKTQVILSSPTMPFERLDISKLSAFEKFFATLKKPADVVNLLNIHTYDCPPITDDFGVTATCVGLPTWFANILSSLSSTENLNSVK